VDPTIIVPAIGIIIVVIAGFAMARAASRNKASDRSEHRGGRRRTSDSDTGSGSYPSIASSGAGKHNGPDSAGHDTSDSGSSSGGSSGGDGGGGGGGE
jgi:hypothetical protein